MVKCSFCDLEIPHGSGRIYVKKDGTAFYFCSNKCNKNLLKLGRSPARTRWTAKAVALKAQGKKHAEGGEESKGKKRGKK
ncbi:MAG: 50S ribosomal protein L24e [Candidatus Diapherotrites archaeon]